MPEAPDNPEVPLGPKGPPRETPWTESLSFNILQVSRDDLVAWLTTTEQDYQIQILNIHWKDGSFHNLAAGVSESVTRRPLEIEQVEQVRSVNFTIAYLDNSQLYLEISRGIVSLRYAARRPNSRAQNRVFAVRNLIESSSAVRRPRFSPARLVPPAALLLAPFLWILLAAPVTAPFADPGGKDLSGTGVLVLMATLVGVFALCLAAATGLYKVKAFANPSQVTDPLVAAYPNRTRVGGLATFGVIVGIFGIIGAIAAVVVVFYTPK